MPAITSRRGHLLLALENLALPEHGATIRATTESPNLPGSDLAVPGFDTHWQTGDLSQLDDDAEIRIRVDWPEPRRVSFVALAGLAFRGLDPLDLRWRIDIHDGTRWQRFDEPRSFVVRSPWGQDPWGAPHLWHGGPGAATLQSLARRLAFHTALHFDEPQTAKILRIVIPRPERVDPAAYLRAAELWASDPWQAEVNFQWGAECSPVDLGTVQLSPDGWDFGDVGRQLRAWSVEWDYVPDDDLHARLLRWWRNGGSKRRFFAVPFPDKAHLWHDLSMPARIRDIRGSVAGFWDPRTDRNTLNLTLEEAFG